MDVVVFMLVYLIVVNWFQLRTFLSVVIGPKIKTSKIVDRWIIDTIYRKTGLKLLDITIFHDSRPYGMMAGLPWLPKMILSEGMYKTFTKDELEWVVLHEAAHNIFWHNIQSIIIQAVILLTGVYLVSSLNLSLSSGLLLAFFLALICIHILRWTIEYTADKFSIGRISNPAGVISAQVKLMSAYRSKFDWYKLFGWNIDRALRIKMAKGHK